MSESLLSPSADPAQKKDGRGAKVPAPFGRETELGLLMQAWRNSRTDPAAVYVEGAAGVGKSLVVARFAQAVRPEADVVLFTAAPRIPARPEAVLQQLQAGLNSDRAVPDAVGELNRRGRAGGGVWIIEGYDAWRTIDPWFRSEVLSCLGPGVLLVLESREPVRRLWAGDFLAQARIRRMTVAPWDDDRTEAYVAARGVEPAWIPLVAGLANGSPALAARMADALAVDRPLLAGAAPPQVLSFLLERALHPGSRRMSWRAGFGDRSLDNLVAAAALLPAFTRDLMEAVVGTGPVELHWETLSGLPFTAMHGPGVYGFAPRFRRLVTPLVQELRPWGSRQWLWRAALRTLETVGAPNAYLRDTVAAEILARGLARPFQALPLLGRLAWDGRGPDPESGPTMLRVEDGRGMTVGWAEGLFPDGAGTQGPVVVTAAGTEPGCADAWPLVLAALLVRTAGAGGLCWQGPPAAGAPALPGLWGEGPAPADEGENREFPAGSDTLLQWLKPRILGPACGSASPVEAVREALTLVNRPQALTGCRLAAFWPGPERPSGPQLRQWLLDALSSADLGDCPPGRRLLTFYYLERRGSHDVVAEQLNVSRATYFRGHQRALQRLAEQLTGAGTLAVLPAGRPGA